MLGDGPVWFSWLVLAVQRVPHVPCGSHDTHLSTRPFHFTPSNHGHVTAVVPRYGTCPTMTCLRDPSRVTQWASKPVHTMEIQAGRSKAGSHNGDPSRFTQWRSKPVHTIEIQAGSHMEVQAASHNGDPKPVHTIQVPAGSHNGDPSRFTQWRS